jgi:hypothetical protein
MAVDSNPLFVKTTLSYSTPPANGERPYRNTFPDPTTGKYGTNLQPHLASEIPIENVRGKESLYTLDTAGFQFFSGYPTKLSYEGFEDEEEIKKVYYPESEELIKKLTGATRVVFFDHSECVVFPDLREGQ